MYIYTEQQIVVSLMTFGHFMVYIYLYIHNSKRCNVLSLKTASYTSFVSDAMVFLGKREHAGRTYKTYITHSVWQRVGVFILLSYL